MDYDNFDNDDPETSDKDYTDYIDCLSERTAAQLRLAKSNPVEQRPILSRYYRRGDLANLTPSELIDFLGVSTPSIFDMAGYTDEEGDAAMALADSLTRDEVNKVELQ